MPPSSLAPCARRVLTSPSTTILSASKPSFHRPRIHHPVRTVATSRRTVKALRTKPFETSPTAPSSPSKRLSKPIQQSIVFNPPPTAPSPYHTPALFLPQEDPRRQLPLLHASPFGPTTTIGQPAGSEEIQLPPAIKAQREKTYHLTPAQVEEIRVLRTSNPWLWTRKRLAEKFGCTEFFVGMAAQALPERMDWAQQNLDAVKARWGPKRRKAREERVKRRKIWERDE